MVEFFEWSSAAAMAAAHEHPAVQAMWAEYAQVCDYVPLAELPEAATLFAEFSPLSAQQPSEESPPPTRGVDHLHVYVPDLAAAEAWYCEVLGYHVVEAFAAWRGTTGPSTLADPAHRVHIALFEAKDRPSSTIAFGATGEQFLQWRDYLEDRAVDVTVKDHQLAWSLYFDDPFGNTHEITTYDCDVVAASR